MKPSLSSVLSLLILSTALPASAQPDPRSFSLETLHFEPASESASELFVHRGNHLDVSLLPLGFRASPRKGVELQSIEVCFLGGSIQPRVTAEGPLPSHSSYFLGGDPTRWRSRVPHYSRVRYHDVWPGIDLVFHGEGGSLEYDFVVAPGADPSSIALSISGGRGVRLDEDGTLAALLDVGEVTQPAPTVYQRGAGGQLSRVKGGFEIAAQGRIGFRVDSYDRSRELVIDPYLSFSTYLGGSGSDGGQAVATDASGNVYVFGMTGSSDFPGTSGTLPGMLDVFVSKLTSQGQLIYSTYLGGSSGELAGGLAVDASGAVYVTGTTYSATFLTKSAFQTSPVALPDAFVMKLDPSGALVYSTYLGGNGQEQGLGIAVDGTGSAVVVGFTSSTDYPTRDALQNQNAGGVEDGFVTRISPDGTALVHSTYLGGSGQDRLWAVACDSAGETVVTGTSDSADFPTLEAAKPVKRASSDATVSRFSRAGVLEYSTFFGGNGYDVGRAIALTPDGSAWVTGLTTSDDLPTFNALQPSAGGSGDALLFRLDATGALVSSTYLGGQGEDQGAGVAVAPDGSVVVAGSTLSFDFRSPGPCSPCTSTAATSSSPGSELTAPACSSPRCSRRARRSTRTASR